MLRAAWCHCSHRSLIWSWVRSMPGCWVCSPVWAEPSLCSSAPSPYWHTVFSIREWHLSSKHTLFKYFNWTHKSHYSREVFKHLIGYGYSIWTLMGTESTFFSIQPRCPWQLTQSSTCIASCFVLRRSAIWSPHTVSLCTWQRLPNISTTSQKSNCIQENIKPASSDKSVCE